MAANEAHPDLDPTVGWPGGEEIDDPKRPIGIVMGRDERQPVAAREEAFDCGDELARVQVQVGPHRPGRVEKVVAGFHGSQFTAMAAAAANRRSMGHVVTPSTAQMPRANTSGAHEARGRRAASSTLGRERDGPWTPSSIR
jgi:hypothetical protein